MAPFTHNIENNIHFLVFPAHIDQWEYEDFFSHIYTIIDDLTGIKLIVDLSPIDYINSGFIGMLSELYSLLEENKGKMIIVSNTTLSDMFKLVGFDDFVDIVFTKEEAINLLK